MKEGWDSIKLADAVDILNGFAFKSSRYVPEGIRVIRISNVQKGYVEDKDPKFYPASSKDEIKKFLLQEGDLLMSLTGNVGRVGLLPGAMLPCALNQRVACLRIKSAKLSKMFLFYLLNSNVFEAMCIKASSGVAQLNMSTEWLKEQVIPLPSLAEQQRIVDILDKEFAKIDALKANVGKKLSNAQSLFQSALKKELDPQSGWSESILVDVARIINGRAYSKEELLSEGKYRVLRVGNFFTNDNWYYSDLELDNEKYCENGDLLYAWSASFGPKIWDGERVIYHYHIWKVQPSEQIDKMFLYYWLQSYQLTSQVMSKLHGTTMVHITKGIMESTTISFPSKERQQIIASKLNCLYAKCESLRNQYERTIDLCNDLKQALLRKAFNGEL